MSCQRDLDNGANRAIEETWGRVSPIPYRFLLGGHDDSRKNATVYVPGPDGYDEQIPRMKAGYRWALENGFTHIFRCDTDTLVVPDRLARSHFEWSSYVGNSSEFTVADKYDCTFAHGGCGFWVDAGAAQILVDAEPFGLFNDQWAGKVLTDAGIKLKHDARYSMGKSYGLDQPQATDANGIISVHLGVGRGTFTPEDMRQAWVYAQPDHPNRRKMRT
jgi:hypothetical protein